MASKRCWFSKILLLVSCCTDEHFVGGQSSLLCIECQQGQIQEQGDPVSVDQEQERQEGMYGGFGNDVGIQTIAQVDRIDIITGNHWLVLFTTCSTSPSSRDFEEHSVLHGRVPTRAGDIPFQIAVHDGEEDL